MEPYDMWFLMPDFFHLIMFLRFIHDAASVIIIIFLLINNIPLNGMIFNGNNFAAMFYTVP